MWNYAPRLEEVLPQTLYVSEESRNDEATKRILGRLGGARIVSFSGNDGADIASCPEALACQRDNSLSRIVELSKRQLVLKHYTGEWVKRCPGTPGHVCCNLWVVHPAEGCLMDCSYCFLQSYLVKSPAGKLYTNVGDMLSAIEQKARSEPNRMFRICTGELTDSLVWDPITDLSLELVPLFSRLPNMLLELKTKTNYVEHLLALEGKHAGRTVVSWSVNPQVIIDTDELKTASLKERIDAASAVAQAGYRVGFHFDPLIWYAGWEDGYREVVSAIFSQIAPKFIAWISISTLRFPPTMRGLIQERFPSSPVSYGEHFLAKDGKLRYFQPMRFQMIRFLWQELKAVDSMMPVYLCMESKAAWRSIAQCGPRAREELEEVFSMSERTGDT